METTLSTSSRNSPSGILGGVTNATHGAVDQVLEAAGMLVEEVPRIIAKSTETAHHAVDELGAASSSATEWLADRGEAVASTTHTMEADARAFVVAHPWKTVLGAVAVAYLLGRISALRG